MATAISRPSFGNVRLRPTVNHRGDPLDAMRGVLFGSLTSLLLFWLPVFLAAR
jgi:hypothetical protein